MGASCNAVVSYFVISNKLTDMNPFVGAFWVSAGGTCFSLIGMLLWEDIVFPNSLRCWLLLAGHAFGIALNSVGVEVALRIVEPLTFNIIYSCKIALFFASQYIVLRNVNRGADNSLEFVGAAVILIGNCLVPVYNCYMHFIEKSKEKFEM